MTLARVWMFGAVYCSVIYIYLARVWMFGAVYCSVNNFISYLTVSCSVFTLLALTMDRRKVSAFLSFYFCFLESSVLPPHIALITPFWKSFRNRNSHSLNVG